jgi:hypothetical protein
MMSSRPCSHPVVVCLNEFEFVRKYRCTDCSGVMLCACDEDVGREFLPHQLKVASEYGTHARLPVTLGFQQRICRECRGVPPEAHPVAAIHGRTSKIKRYYWREIWFLEQRLLQKWALAHGLSPKELTGPEADTAPEEASEQALDEIKKLHAERPKYVFAEESQDALLRRLDVAIVDLRVTYARKSEDRRAQVFDEAERVSVEEYVTRHYQRDGWSVLRLESLELTRFCGARAAVAQGAHDAEVTSTVRC